MCCCLKGIEIFEREDYMSKIRHIEQISRQEMENSLTRASKKSVSWAAVPASKSMIQRPWKVSSSLPMNAGVFCRPFLNYMYSMVPYVISDEELIQIFDVMKEWFH